MASPKNTSTASKRATQNRRPPQMPPNAVEDQPFAANTADLRLPTTLIMSAAEWLAVPDNPRQRDTDRHLLRAKHLQRPSPAHLQVNAARLPDGTLIKLDGHTRARLWELHPEMAPAQVLATIIDVDTLDDAALLYHHYDNRAAVDTASDDLSGAFRSVGFEPKSVLFRSYRGTHALKMATAAVMGRHNTTLLDIYKVVPLWLEQLQAIDAIGAEPRRFNHNGVIAAALVAIARRGHHAIACLDRFQRDAGVKTTAMMDGVEALVRLVLSGAGGSNRDSLAMFGRALSCIEGYVEDRAFPAAARGSMRRINPVYYAAGLRQPQREPFERLLLEVQEADAEQQRLRYAVRRYILRD